MYFVIQVVSRTENEMMKTIKDYVPKPFIKDIFVPLRKRMKKIDSKWIEYEERCFPGYIFVETDYPKELNGELRKIEKFSMLVGFGKGASRYFMPLSEDEEKMINRLIGKNNVIDLSRITIEEGKVVKIIDGPLMGFEGTIIKYNLHKRVAMVEIDFAGNKSKIQLGIDIIEEKK